MIETEEDILTKIETEIKEKTETSWNIVLYNDEVNSFIYVIQCLMEVCGHTIEQAEQCTYLVHYKGKCSVKEGDYFDLLPIHEALLDRKLRSKLEK